MRRAIWLGMTCFMVALASCSPPQEAKKPEPALASAGESAKILHITSESDFKSRILDVKGVCLVDFYADWCAPCRQLAPVVSSLAETYVGRATVGKVNVDEAGSVAQLYAIRSIPTVLFVKNGEEIDRFVGFRREQDYAARLDRALE